MIPTGIELLSQDENMLLNAVEFQDLEFSSSNAVDGKKIWKLAVKGSENSNYCGQKYDIEIKFHNRFPFNPPIVLIPPTKTLLGFIGSASNI